MAVNNEYGKGPRILHTSDLHLGADLLHANNERSFSLLERLVAVAREENVDLVVFAGDLFDGNYVAEEILQRTATVLRDLHVPIVILPGNHDCNVPNSVYRRFDWTAALPQAYIIDDEVGTDLHFDSLDLAIWGRPHTSYSDFRPLAAPPARTSERWQVAVAHGHLVQEECDLSRSYCILPSDIAATQRDYVALGHWELMFEASEGDVLAAYSGAPQRKNEVLIVDLGPETQLRKRPL